MKFELLKNIFEKFVIVVTSVEAYIQIGVIILIYFVSYFFANQLRKTAPLFCEPISEKVNPLRILSYRAGKLLFPVFALLLLRLSIEFTSIHLNHGLVMKAAMTIGLLLLFNSFVHLLVPKGPAATAFRWIGLPIVFLHAIGYLDDVVRVLDSISIEVGNIKLSAYGITRTVIFGSLLYWMGRASNTTGKELIRKQEKLDYKTREIFAKLFELSLLTFFIVVLMQLMGINLTTFAVFGGAIGVGLGFGLQAITSNFISGLIIIFDRSVSVGDYIELEDKRTGRVTDLKMRSTTLETYDGKDIVVPNEKFISSSFTNWTHKNQKQRYRVDFSVSYRTDIRSMVELIKEAVATHPQVMSGDDLPIEERPDCEISSFGDSGVNMFVEFWMEGIDDGKNRVGGDLMLIIFETLKKNDIEIPFPQREVRVLS